MQAATHSDSPEFPEGAQRHTSLLARVHTELISVDIKQAELAGIIYGVLVPSGSFKSMLVVQPDGTVVNHPDIYLLLTKEELR